MYLAQELVDYIIDFLHDDPKSLIQASLVSKAWVGRTRTHLCETMTIIRSKFMSAGPSHLAPLCGYVKTLHFRWPIDNTDPSAILDCFELSQLHTLAIHSCELHSLDEQTIQRCFAKFPGASINTLELHDISPTHRTFLTLLSLFPNVDNLTISVNRWWKDRPRRGPFIMNDSDDEVVQHISPRFGGSFKFLDPPYHEISGYRRRQLLRTLAALPLQFQTVSLDTIEQSWEDVFIFLKSCSKTARKVFIELASLDGPIDLSPIYFANLEELRFSRWSVNNCTFCKVPLLQWAAIPSLQRVILEVDRAACLCSHLDDALVNMIERHKPHGNLNLQLSTMALPQYVLGLLPRLARLGVLEVYHTKRPDCYG